MPISILLTFRNVPNFTLGDVEEESDDEEVDTGANNVSSGEDLSDSRFLDVDLKRGGELTPLLPK